MLTVRVVYHELPSLPFSFYITDMRYRYIYLNTDFLKEIIWIGGLYYLSISFQDNKGDVTKYL